MQDKWSETLIGSAGLGKSENRHGQNAKSLKYCHEKSQKITKNKPGNLITTHPSTP